MELVTGLGLCRRASRGGAVTEPGLQAGVRALVEAELGSALGAKLQALLEECVEERGELRIGLRLRAGPYRDSSRRGAEESSMARRFIRILGPSGGEVAGP
jgi:hypothetical protein